jgi:hypothetical protein
LNLSEIGGAEAGSQLRGMVFLGTRKDETETTQTVTQTTPHPTSTEGGVDHSSDVPNATPIVTGTFKFCGGSFFL